MDLMYRVLGAVGVTGGTMALLVFVGFFGDEQGDVALLVLAVVFLSIGVPSLLKWIKTL